MARLAEDRFRIFVSHKHEDHALAVAVQQALEGISPKIECFVSGVSIAAGADWNHEIRSSLAQSHLLILLFTRPTATWDWCLFETGLFTRSRRRRCLRRRLPLRPDGDHAEPTGQPAGHPGTPRRRGALPRRPLPRDVASVRRLAPRRPASPRAARPAGGRGSEDRRRLPGPGGRPRIAPSVPPRRPRPAPRRLPRRRHPGGREGRHRARRDDPLHLGDVQPGGDDVRRHVGSTGRCRGRPHGGMAHAARPPVRRRLEQGAVHADHRDVPSLERGSPSPADPQADPVPDPVGAAGPRARNRSGAVAGPPR